MQILVVHLLKKNQHSFLAQEIKAFSCTKGQFQSFVQSHQHRQHMLKFCSSILGDLISMVVFTGKQEAYAFAVCEVLMKGAI